MSMRTLSTTSEVIDALGGTAEVARLTGRKLNAASNWHQFQTFPPDTFLTMQEALSDIGIKAPAWLWRQAPKKKAS